MQNVICCAIPEVVISLLHGTSLMVEVRSFLATKWDGFGVDHQQKGHICDVESAGLAGIKENGEGTARDQQTEKPPGDPMVEQELITMHAPLCSNLVLKRSCQKVCA